VAFILEKNPRVQALIKPGDHRAIKPVDQQEVTEVLECI